MLDLRTGKEMTRRETIKGGLGLAAILAAGKAPAMLLGARGIAFGKEPLPYDEELEYLEGDGNQYINTGFVVQGRRPIVEWKSQRLSIVIGANSCAEFGMWASNNRRFQMYITDFGIGSLSTSFIVDTYEHVYKMNSSNLTANRDSVSYTGFNVSNGFGDTPLFLFSRSGTEDNPRFIGRYWYYKAWDGSFSNPVQDLKPVLKNGVPCFYDRIENRFFYNEISGHQFGYKKKDGTIVNPT